MALSCKRLGAAWLAYAGPPTAQLDTIALRSTACTAGHLCRATHHSTADIKELMNGTVDLSALVRPGLGKQ